jgi:glycosyltransferase involved in cell wall biosynthesis
MATYNGDRFVREQVESILEQLHPDDELIVVDDASKDDTAALVEGFPDPRLRLFRHERNAGYVRTFEEALTKASGEILLLSDQDDVWLPGHREVLARAAGTSGVAASNLSVLGRPGGLPGPYGQRDWALHDQDSGRPWRNLTVVLAGNRPYFGCAMAFDSSMRDLILPFPTFLHESHDLWIAICGNVARRLVHLEDHTVARRLHDANTSPPRPRALPTVLKSRRLVARMILEGRRRAGSRPAPVP